jgi:hypothetical protein
MISRRSPRDPRPDLLKPYLVTVSGDHTEYARRDARAAVPAGLALHQNELNVVLNDRIRLIGLTEETAAITLGLINGVCNLAPDNGS